MLYRLGIAGFKFGALNAPDSLAEESKLRADSLMIGPDRAARLLNDFLRVGEEL